MMKAGFRISEWLFPPRCVGCDELLPLTGPYAGSVFCPLCATLLEAARVRDPRPGDGCGTDAPVSLVYYHPGEPEGVPQRLIYHLKHRNDRRVFSWVAAQLAPRVAARLTAQGIDPATVIFTYPPRRKQAVRKDGFDQAKKISHALARAMGGRCLPLIRRTSPWGKGAGREQKRLVAAQRKANADASYLLNPRRAAAADDSFVVLVDDLSTTGATLSRCTTLLHRASGVLWVTVGVTR